MAEKSSHKFLALSMKLAPKMLFTALILVGISLAMISCGPSQSTSTTHNVTPYSGSDLSHGFRLTVNVNDTTPDLGGRVEIKAILQDESNTQVSLQNLGGGMLIEVKNEDGQIVWGVNSARPGTTLTASVGPGWQYVADEIWVVKTDPNFNVDVKAGQYFLTVTDGFVDPTSGQRVTLSVGPAVLGVRG
jgi:hypothetical protein